MHTCGAQALAILQGGTYEIDNCTFALYSSISKQEATKVEHLQEPAVAILNYFENKATNQVFADSLNAVLRNCIIWGSLEDELFTSKVENFKYNLVLDHCIIKTKEVASIVTPISNKINQDPGFADQVGGDYRVKAGSPAIDGGVQGVSTDLDGKARPQGGATDIGCYEF